MPTLTFLGHAACIIKGEHSTVVIDPFLTGNPAATIGPQEVTCTHVALSHGHEDHVGDTLAIAGANDATIVASYEICNWASGEGHENVNPGNPGGRVPLNSDDWLAFTRAYHSSSYEGRYMGQPCGLIVHVDGRTVYHAGDTDLFSDMKLIGETYNPDVAMLPIGDRFTMGPALATKAADFVGAPRVVPMHYDTWPPIEVDVHQFKPAAEVCLMQAGDTLEL
jgi:L-ascorbate metabolism protein UlaG (beta-lactamase superfamily)